MNYLLLAPELGLRGGIERYNTVLAHSLVELQGSAAVHVLTLLNSRAELPSGVWHQAAGSSVSNTQTKARFVLQALNQTAVWRPDLVLCLHIHLAPIALGLKILFGVPYGLAAYGYEAWNPLSPLRRQALQHADFVTSISEFTTKMLREEHDVPETRIHLLRPVVDSASLRNGNVSAGNAVSRRLEGKRVILTVARLDSRERYKGHDTVIRALPAVQARMPDVTYVVVGEGDDRQRLEQLARETGVADAVIFTGWVDGETLSACYQACDVFVMPSRLERRNGMWFGEGFGIVYLEAAAFGKPCIAGKYGATAEAVLDGVSGLLVDPNNVDEVARSLIALLSNPDLAQRMGEAGRQRVLTEFTPETFTNQLARILKDWERNRVRHRRRHNT